MDAQSQELLAGFKPQERRELASCTKMITIYVIYILCKRFNVDPKTTLITVTKEAEEIGKIGCNARLKTGDKLTLFDLLHAIILPSGNDACHLVA